MIQIISSEKINTKTEKENSSPKNESNNPNEKRLITPNNKTSRENKFKEILLILLFCIALLSFIGIIPFIACWYLWKKTKFSKQIKIYATIGIVVICICSFIGCDIYFHAPALVISSPVDQATISSTTVQIIGTVNPKSSAVQINTQTVSINKDGSFMFDLPLPQTELTIDIIATYHGVDKEQKLTIHRLPTSEEIVEQAARVMAQKKAADERAAEKKAAEAAWTNSRAGQICLKHPFWTRDDCINLANNKVWIGMNLDMLKVLRGIPNNANPSNYGNGIQWQWCWNNHTPSCFYGGNDGIITSYN